MTGPPVATVLEGTEADDTKVIALRGELDASNAPMARLVIDQVLGEHLERLVFDMADLTFMDSSGIAVLVHAANNTGTVELHHPSQIIRRVLEITGLSDTFTITS